MLRVVAALAILATCGLARADDPPKPAGVMTKPPKLLQAVAPEYPPAALAAGKTAKVKVLLHIAADGTVTGADAVDKVGDGFDEAAVAAALQYVFDPAEVDGVPAPITVETAINFTIEQRVEEPAPPPPPTKDHTGPPNHAGDMAAPITFAGVCVERGTRKPLAGVIVAIGDLGIDGRDLARPAAPPHGGAVMNDVITDETGAFFFHGLPPGKYQVLAVDPKYRRVERPIEIAKHENLTVRLWMQPLDANPYESVVEGEREVVEVTKRSLQREQLTSVPGTFGDPIRTLQTLPGMQRAPFGLGILLVRGSNPDDTGIYVDGHEVPALFHFLGGPSIFNADMLESIDLYPGGFPARFGRHHGGAVALELRATKSDGVHGNAKVDFFDAGGYLRAPITKDLSFAVSARRSYIDAFLGFVLPKPSAGATRIVTPVYYDYAGRLDYDLHEDGKLSLFAIGSSDALHVLNEDPDANVSQKLDSTVKFFRFIGSYKRHLGGDLDLTLSPAWGRDSVSVSGAQALASGPFTSIDVVNDDLSYRMRVNGKLGHRLVLDTGIDILSRITSYQALIPIDDNLISSSGIDIPPSQIFRGSQELGVGAYLDLAIDVTDRLRLITSARWDGYILDGQTRESFDPRLVARLKLDAEWTLKAYVGRFSQPPQPEALDRRFGNPNVGLEHAEHYGLGYEWRPGRLWSIDSEIYYVDRHDLVVFTSDAQQNADGTYSYVNFRNEGVMDSYGLEMMIKREISEHVYGWLSYTFSRSHRRNHPDESISATTFDQPHVLNAIASWKPGHGWELGARFQLASGRPDAPVLGATFDADTGKFVPIRGEARSIRQPLYRQIDVRAEHDWLFDTWSLGLYLDIINVTNATNVEAVQYDFRYRQSSPVSGFPILPTLGLKGTW